MHQEFHGTAYGVDGCRGGWFWVALEPDGQIRASGVAKALSDLVERAGPGDRIFVDIPIGLQPDTRECDMCARKLLRSRRASSVFPVPVREALDCSTDAEASRRNHELTGRKLSVQSLVIRKKISEVDKLLRCSEKARRLVREVHPELCFWGFAGHSMREPKKSKEGYRERIEVLRQYRPEAGREIEGMMKRYLRKVVARDDIVDAMAAAMTASAKPSDLRTLPQVPQRDSEGLPMQMVYVQKNPAGGPVNLP